MTKRRQKQQETFDCQAAARALGADWILLDDNMECPDLRVREGGRDFGLEHVTVHCGARTEEPGRKPVPELAVRNKRRERLIDGVRRRLTAAYDVPLRVVMQGTVTEGTTNMLADNLLAVDWACESVGRLMNIQCIPGLKTYAMRSFRPEWVDVDAAVGWVDRLGIVRLQETIDSKKPKLLSYRLNAGGDVRLLVVANHYQAQGKVDVPEFMEVDAGGFSRIYFMAIPKYVIEFGDDGQVLRRRPWPGVSEH
jgi:hypothetical protein